MRRAVLVLLALLLIASSAPANALAGTDDARDDRSVAVGPQNFELRDLTVTVADVHVEGTGLPDRSIDRASYTVDDATVSTDGFVVVYQDTSYRIGAISVTVDNVGLQVENVSISDASGSN
ncbi:hypothetical protein [Halomarina pelagica]|uniref:hypothetical protein n=1 Tax=Halomarina pelagica TaxID=2961599 RepID=UPI0020C3A9DF|nr:hypothetical protein [Halomarina sp. BND7]